jgi:tetratricopeptide (TPR) repeat protein
MGLSAWYMGKIEEAYWFFRKAVSLTPTDTDSLVNFSDAALALGRPGEAVTLLEAALTLDPSLTEASDLLERIRREDRRGGADYATVVLARELTREGDRLLSEGLFDKAGAVFTKLLVQDSGNFTAINNLGLVDWYRGDAAAAYAKFRQSLELSPAYEDALINLFDAALALKKVDEVRPLFERALAQNPSLRDAREILSQIKLRGNHIYDIGHYSQIDPGLRLNAEGRALLEEHKLGEATLKYLDAIEQHGENSDSYCGLGIIQYYRGEYHDAFKLFQRAVELNPLSQDALVNLYDAALKTSDVPAVLPRLENALAMDPSLDDLRRILEGTPPAELP